jgi:hypothetical protein
MKARITAGAMTLLLAFSLADAASAAPAVGCKTARARYEMMGAPGFTAGFRPEPKRPGWLTDVSFFLRSAQTGKTFWFLFDEGSARYVNMISTTDVTAPGWAPPDPDGGARPLGEMHYLAADAALKFDPRLPRQDAPAPTYVLLPDLAETLWYRQRDGAKEAAPTAFLKLVGC